MRRLRLFTAADPADPYLDEPPPGPYDYPYGYSDATLADLDFTDLPRQRPTRAPTNIDLDLGALRARRKADHTHAAALAEAILSRCTGPAETAAAEELAALQQRHHQQRPHQHERAHAHWVHAEHTAEIHRVLLDQLNAHAAQAEQRGDTALFTPYAMRRDQLAEHTAVTETRQQLDAARIALLDIAGGPEGIITERDIIARRVTAQHADINVLNLARAHARELAPHSPGLKPRPPAPSPAASPDHAITVLWLMPRPVNASATTPRTAISAHAAFRQVTKCPAALYLPRLPTSRA